MSRFEPLVAVLRRCRACDRWRSIEMFYPLGKVCQECVNGVRPSGRIARSRCMQITPQGREALKVLA